MKRKVLGILLVVLLLGGCGSTATDNAETVSQEATSNDEAAAEEHVHDYIEEVEEATCEKDGVKTYTCECGDSYTEEIKATGHVFSEYLYNDDATFTEDGTETAKCSACDIEDTRTAQGTKKEYTYTDVEQTMYAEGEVNVRNMPDKDSEKLGTLVNGQEVHVTGKCNEAYFYRIAYEEAIGYVSGDYLVSEKPVQEKQPGTETPSNGAQSNEAPAPAVSAGNEPCPYPLYTMFYDNQGFPYFYGSYGGSANMLPEHLAQTDACMDQMEDYVQDNFPRESWEYGEEYFNSISWKSIGRYDNLQVVVRYYGHLHGIALAKPEERGIPTAGNGIWKK